MSSDDRVQKPDNLNYKPVQMHNGRYRMRQLQLNNAQIANVSLTANGNTLLEWVMPAREVFNMARSNFQYTITYPAQGANKASWIFDDTVEVCNSVTVGTAAQPTALMDLQFASNYISTARKIDTCLEEFETSDYTSGLHPSDATVVGVAAVAAGANFFPPTAVVGASNPYGLAAGTYEEALTLREPHYARSSAVDTALTVTRIVPFSAFTHTVLGMDRDQVFSEDIYVRVMLSGSYKFGYTATTSTDPVGGAAAFVNQPLISALYCNLAMQEDEYVKASVLDKYSRGDMKFLIPYTYGWRQTTAAAGQAAININVNKSFGKKLKRFLYLPFDATETTSASVNKAYDHQNMSSDKITQFQTLLASKPLQDQQVLVATMDDWRLNKQFCRDSAIRNSACYYYNWFHCDSWSQPKRGMVPTENIWEGLDLTEVNQTYTINATTLKGVNHYVFAEFIREVQSKPSGLEVVI